MDKETGEQVLINGEPITSEVTFTPTSPEGAVEVFFTVPLETMAGKTVVVFEDLWKDGRLVAIHHDINDEAQTVKIPEPEKTVKIPEPDKKPPTDDLSRSPLIYLGTGIGALLMLVFMVIFKKRRRQASEV